MVSSSTPYEERIIQYTTTGACLNILKLSNKKRYVSTSFTGNPRHETLLVLYPERTAYSVEKQRTEYCSLPSSGCYEKFKSFSAVLNMQAAMEYLNFHGQLHMVQTPLNLRKFHIAHVKEKLHLR